MICEIIVDDRGGRCGRRSDVKRTMVRGPGFTIAETRLVCGRCRGEERPPLAVPPKPPTIRPPCPVCSARTSSKTGICHNCRMALDFHCRKNPHRLPRAGTRSRMALAHIRPAEVAKMKQGKVMLRLKKKLDQGPGEGKI